MFNKRFLLVFALAVMTLLIAVPAAQADEAPGYDIVVRVFMDATNDVHDNGDFGLQGWVIQLSGDGPRQFATTGPDGFASFRDLNPAASYTVRVVQNPHGGAAWENGWRMARSNATSDTTGRTKYIVGSSYTVQPGDFELRVNDDYEAWVRFSAIRVQRISIGGAIPGDTFIFERQQPNGSWREVGRDGVGPNGFASMVGGGLFYESTIRITSEDTGAQAMIRIPYSYQPNFTFVAPNTLTCTGDCNNYPN